MKNTTHIAVMIGVMVTNTSPQGQADIARDVTGCHFI
jgi:hypothetical protein